MELLQNHPLVEMTVTGPTGKQRALRFLLDTGGGAIILPGSVARELDFDLSAPADTSEGTHQVTLKTPGLKLGDMPLDVGEIRALAEIKDEPILPGIGIHGLIPGRLLRRYHAIFDYPGHRFTLAEPGKLTPKGVALPAKIDPNTGFPRIELTIDGRLEGFLLDTGASYTMLDGPTLRRWSVEHPTWPRNTGAVGLANMGGNPMEGAALMLRAPSLKCGPFDVRDVGLVARPRGTFGPGSWMSGMMTAPILGSLAGNVLREFRVEIDYAHEQVYLERTGRSPAHEMDLVPLVLRQGTKGEWIIMSVPPANLAGLGGQVLPGDVLERVDGQAMMGKTIEQVTHALSGPIASTHKLVIQREGRHLRVAAKVARHI
jgi:hypothetical protein